MYASQKTFEPLDRLLPSFVRILFSTRGKIGCFEMPKDYLRRDHDPPPQVQKFSPGDIRAGMNSLVSALFHSNVLYIAVKVIGRRLCRPPSRAAVAKDMQL